MSKYKGTGVAAITPFTTDKQVDFEALRKILKHLIARGIDYLVALGTTGESVTLDADERNAILEVFAEEAHGKVPLVLGLGGNDSKEISRTMAQTGAQAFDAFLSVSPYYNKPSQEGIYQHYALLAKSTDKDIILYNVPGRTASNMSADTTLRLAREFSNIVAVKEASGDLVQAMNIAESKPDGFDLISGDDSLTLPMQAIGGVGAISVIAHAYPKEFTSMVNAANNGDFQSAYKHHMSINKVTQLIYTEGNPTGIKALMNLKGFCEKSVRLPLVEASAELSEELATKA